MGKERLNEATFSVRLAVERNRDWWLEPGIGLTSSEKIVQNLQLSMFH